MNKTAVTILGEDAINRTWQVVAKNIFIQNHKMSTEVEPTSIKLSELRTFDDDYYQVSITQMQHNRKIVSMSNITLLKNLEKQIAMTKRADAQMEFSSSLAHQLRTPITTAMLYASQLAEGEKGESSDKAKKIINSLNHLSGIVDNLLDYTRGIIPKPKAVKVSVLIEELMKNIEGRLNQTKVKINYVPNYSEIKVKVDKVSIVSALENLVENALDVQDKGYITIYTQHAGVNKVDLVVQDSGTGMEENLLEKIFQPFFTSKAKGTGIGLPLVKSIVEANFGEVWVESIKNFGSKFGIRLPLVT